MTSIASHQRGIFAYANPNESKEPVPGKHPRLREIGFRCGGGVDRARNLSDATHAASVRPEAASPGASL